MPLELHRPPLLVAVARSGQVLPALLLASRGNRRFVQLSRGAGANHLVWVEADDLRVQVSAPGPASAAVPGVAPGPAAAPGPTMAPAPDAAGGLPWARRRAPQVLGPAAR